MIQKICRKCDKIFFVRTSEKNQKFCSRICSGTNNQQITYCCLLCKDIFKRKPCEKNVKYCSKKCQILSNPYRFFFEKGNTHAKVEKIKLLCPQCNLYFEVLPHDKNRRKLCSRQCSKLTIGQSIKETYKNNRMKYLIRNFERFVIRGTNEDDCWFWSGSHHYKGYGNSSGTKAHRVAWMIYKGEIPNGMFVCHNCPGGDNKGCCNPQHMFLSDNQGNIIDAALKGRLGRKLTIEKVKEIKKKLLTGLKQYDIAKEYGVKQTTISEINIGKTWKHVTLDSQ